MITIVDYQAAYQAYFEEFNKQWISEHFKLEPVDTYVLEHPREAILDEGGIILFASDGESIIGTVALKSMAPGTYELTKMAVGKAFRGKGAGRVLCQAAVDRARQIGARKLILYSHTSLSAAIAIYRKLGFTEVPLEAGKYERADIKMELSLVLS